MPVHVTADARAGQIDLLDEPRIEGGGDVHRTYEEPGERYLDLDLDVTLGSIVVTRGRVP